MALTALPQLSYALVAFRPGEYARFIPALADLRDLGFRWVTLMPTYLVHDSVPPSVGADPGPSIAEVAEIAQAAVEAGLNIKFEPHLDWEMTLQGGPYEWRRRFYAEPDGEYAERLIAPLFGLAVEAARCGAQVALTLGSELDVSLSAFPERWAAVWRALHELEPSIPLGHNINHDYLGSSPEIRKLWRLERARRGMEPLDWRGRSECERATHSYLGRLDYVGFSFYPNAKAGRSLYWWRGQTTQLHARVVGRAFQKDVQKLTSRLRRACGDTPRFAIGEFGLGCADPTRPWHFDRTTFLDGSGAMDSGAAGMRRKFYLGMLECLRAAPHLFGAHPVTFWTVTHFDFLGTLGYPDGSLFRDEGLRQAILRYNSER